MCLLVSARWEESEEGACRPDSLGCPLCPLLSTNPFSWKRLGSDRWRWVERAIIISWLPKRCGEGSISLPEADRTSLFVRSQGGNWFTWQSCSSAALVPHCSRRKRLLQVKWEAQRTEREREIQLSFKTLNLNPSKLCFQLEEFFFKKKNPLL